MKKKLSKRLAILLLLLVAVAVGGAYVLNSVNSGEGALAAAAYTATGMKSYMPLQNDVKMYGSNTYGTGFGMGDNYFSGLKLGTEIPLPGQEGGDEGKCKWSDPLKCPGQILKPMGEKVDKRNYLDEMSTECFKAGGDTITFTLDGKGKPANAKCESSKPAKKKK